MAKLLREVVEVTPQVETHMGCQLGLPQHGRGSNQPKSVGAFARWGAGQVRPLTSPAKRELDGESRLPMVTTVMKWVSITALLLVVLLRPSASHQLALDFLVCAGAFMIILALFFKTRDRGLPQRG